MTDSESADEGWALAQKPGPLLRILHENTKRPLKSPGKCYSPSSSQSQSSHDKENLPHIALTKLKDKSKLCPENSRDKLADSSEFLSPEALSSTLAVQQSSQGTPERLRPILFSTHNLSAISALVNSSQNVSSSPQEVNRFRTPKRRDVFETPSTTASSSGSSKTPGSIRNSSSLDSRATPESRKNETSSSCRTPSSASSRGVLTPSGGVDLRTPSSRREGSTTGSSGAWSSSASGIRYNPFETHHTADLLHLPTMSPSVFATVRSPSCQQEEDATVNGQFWSIEQQAVLYPAAISDDSPLKQSINHKNHRKEVESRTQEQIELYFSTYHDVTSPPDLPPTGPLRLDPSPDKDESYTQPDTSKASKWTQTCMSLPPMLPAPVENVLRQYGLIMNIDEEANNLSNSTLRRKLFNVDMMGEDGDCDESSSEDEEGIVVKILTPGKLMRTPVMSKSNLTSAQWSSSPLRATRHRTSVSPPDLNSPMFSPIAKGSARRASPDADQSTFGSVFGSGSEASKDIVVEELENSQLCTTVNMETDSFLSCLTAADSCDAAASETPSAPSSQEAVNDMSISSVPIQMTGECWRQAPDYDSTTNHSYVTVSTVSVSPPCSSMIAVVEEETWESKEERIGGLPSCLVSSRDKEEEEDGGGHVTPRFQEEDSSAGVLTLPTLAEESSNMMNTESRADTGYTTNTASSLLPSNLQEDSSQPSSLLVQDSGMCTSQPPSLTASFILPQAPQPQQHNPHQPQVLMSYDAEGNDISVGFPLGSSTPTRI